MIQFDDTPYYDDCAAEELPPKKELPKKELVVFLDGFEGPIDLLLALAREQKLDLTQIAILPLAQQYLAFVQHAQELDIDLAADYLVMAAVLAYLKSRLLLPTGTGEEGEEAINLADALKFQLMRLASMQKAAQTLMALPRLGQERFANGTPEPLTHETTVEMSATLFDLLGAYGAIAAKGEAAPLTIEASQLFSVEDAIKRLSNLLKNMPSTWHDFASILPKNMGIDSRSAVSTHFAASLELVRDGKIKFRQDESFGRIWLQREAL